MAYVTGAIYDKRTKVDRKHDILKDAIFTKDLSSTASLEPVKHVHETIEPSGQSSLRQVEIIIAIIVGLIAIIGFLFGTDSLGGLLETLGIGF